LEPHNRLLLQTLHDHLLLKTINRLRCPHRLLLQTLHNHLLPKTINHLHYLHRLQLQTELPTLHTAKKPPQLPRSTRRIRSTMGLVKVSTLSWLSSLIFARELV
jgi:hypothetical protein